MATDMKAFFGAVAIRMRKENALSDMTFALCQGNIEFKQFFLDFFFGKGIVKAESAVITREYAKEDSRPDFWIEADGRLYIVEVKIWDVNHHFKQYLKFIQNDKTRLGYIAAYAITTDEDGALVNDGSYPGLKTWKEFVLALKNAGVQEDGLGAGDPAIVGYMKFVRQVCGIGEEYPPLKAITAEPLRMLNLIGRCYVKAVMFCSKRVHECEFYTRSPNNSDFSYRKGVFFQFDYRGETAYGFIGIYFGGAKELPTFVIGFENKPGWAQNVCSDFKTSSAESGLWFYPDQETVLGDNDELGKYLERVLDGLNSGDISWLSFEKRELKPFEVLKQAQLFDRLLRMGGLDFAGVVSGVEYSVKYYANSRTWDGAVGEYFEIAVPSRDVVTWGWAGLTYSNDVFSGVLRFRSDWSGPFKDSGEIVFWDGTGSISMDEYVGNLKRKVEELVVEELVAKIGRQA